MEQKGRPYRVEKYNPEWKTLYEKERAIILNVFGGIALRVEHIGSTSVEELWAKPQIDILVVVDSLSLVDSLVDAMVAEGYNYHGESVVPGEKYFTRDASTGERLVSVHVCSKDNERSISSIYFRDYLRSNSEDRDLYSKTKIQAYDSGKTDREDYPAKKKEVSESIKEKAKKWHEAQEK